MQLMYGTFFISVGVCFIHGKRLQLVYIKSGGNDDEK